MIKPARELSSSAPAVNFWLCTLTLEVVPVLSPEGFSDFREPLHDKIKMGGGTCSFFYFVIVGEAGDGDQHSRGAHVLCTLAEGLYEGEQMD